MVKARIVKRVYPDFSCEYVIQQKHFLFWWWWVDAWVNSLSGANSSFKTLEEARDNLIWFRGIKPRDYVIQYTPDSKENAGNQIG